MKKNSKIYIAGHKGMAGSAILRALQKDGYTNLVFRTRSELDLENQQQVKDFFNEQKPEYVFMAAAKVGGIAANIKSPADFLYSNLMIQTNVIDAAYKSGVQKLVFLGSSCVYPRESKQPMREEYLMQGAVEPTNEGYAIAKIAGIKMCEYYKKQYGFNAVSVQPPNLFGEGDCFELENAHVVGALFSRFYAAKKAKTTSVTLWGTGTARRELMYVDDAAKACLFAAQKNLPNSFYNSGTNSDISICDLANKIKNIIGYEGEINFDSTKPDGMPKKLMDSSNINALGWHSEYSLDDGLDKMYKYFKSIHTEEDVL